MRPILLKLTSSPKVWGPIAAGVLIVVVGLWFFAFGGSEPVHPPSGPPMTPDQLASKRRHNMPKGAPKGADESSGVAPTPDSPGDSRDR